MKIPYVQIVTKDGNHHARQSVDIPENLQYEFCCDKLRDFYKGDLAAIQDGELQLNFWDPDEDGYQGRTASFCPFCGQKVEPVEVKRVVRTWTTKTVTRRAPETSYHDRTIPVPKSKG